MAGLVPGSANVGGWVERRDTPTVRGPEGREEALLGEVWMIPDVYRRCCVGDPGLGEEHAHSFGGGLGFVGTVGDEGAGEGGEAWVVLVSLRVRGDGGG